MDEIKSCTLLKMTIHGWKYFATEKPEAEKTISVSLILYFGYFALSVLHQAIRSTTKETPRRFKCK